MKFILASPTIGLSHYMGADPNFLLLLPNLTNSKDCLSNDIIELFDPHATTSQ